MTRIDLVYNIIKDFNDMPKPAQIHMLKMLADDVEPLEHTKQHMDKNSKNCMTI